MERTAETEPLSTAGVEALVVTAFLPGQPIVVVPASGALVIGRSRTSDIRLEDASISREHARMRFDGTNGITIEDLGSRNGVRIAGVPIMANTAVPFGCDVLVEVGRAIVVVRLRGGTETARVEPLPPLSSQDTSKESPMDRVDRLVRLVADSAMSVVLRGETGTGKDVMAERIHALSPRCAKPFIAVNCAATAESLMESEWFGHEKGAFTGAVGAKVGVLEATRGGTLFLDEVGELPLSLQAKLLRALEKREVLPVGSTTPRPFEARIVAATHRSLEDMVVAGTFRRDLLFRLNGMTIELPPLRARRDEIAELAQEFAAQAAQQAGKPQSTVSPGALQKLMGYEFPGNVRELRNVIERAALLAGYGVIMPEHVHWGAATAPGAASGATGNATSGGADGSLRTEVERVELASVLSALEKTGGNQRKAAELLGITRRALIYRLDRYNVDRPRRK